MGILGKAGIGVTFIRENNPSATDMAPMANMVEAIQQLQAQLAAADAARVAMQAANTELQNRVSNLTATGAAATASVSAIDIGMIAKLDNFEGSDEE